MPAPEHTYTVEITLPQQVIDQITALEHMIKTLSTEVDRIDTARKYAEGVAADLRKQLQWAQGENDRLSGLNDHLTRTLESARVQLSTAEKSLQEGDKQNQALHERIARLESRGRAATIQPPRPTFPPAPEERQEPSPTTPLHDPDASRSRLWHAINDHLMTREEPDLGRAVLRGRIRLLEQEVVKERTSAMLLNNQAARVQEEHKAAMAAQQARVAQLEEENRAIRASYDALLASVARSKAQRF